ncbi:MAG: DUF6334 family protein [Leptolyngbyaceae cyanobacterium bins.302]|nr:DUF6334 family protein [Leptolyngbyaceae cyanobacterium bins.302]
MTYEAGHLEESQYVHDVELLHRPDAVILVFQHRKFTIQAVAEDDTINLIAEVVLLDSSFEYKLTSVSEREPWVKAIGKKIGWAWMLTNQQGYFDSIQFDFSNSDSEALVPLSGET